MLFREVNGVVPDCLAECFWGWGVSANKVFG